MAEVMKAIPFTQFSMEMRSGKIIDIDDGFTELLGYTEDDFEAGFVFTLSKSSHPTIPNKTSPHINIFLIFIRLAFKIQHLSLHLHTL